MKRVSENRRSGGSHSLFLWTYFSNTYFATGQQKSRSKHFDVCSDMAEWEGFEPSSRVSGYTISSRARYDHFDTTPYSVPAAASSRLAQALLCDSDIYYNRYSPFVKYFFKISFYFFRPAQHLGKAVPYRANRVNKKTSKQGFRSKNSFDKTAGPKLICPLSPAWTPPFIPAAPQGRQ